MKAIRTLMLSITLMAMNGIIYAGAGSEAQNHSQVNHVFLTDNIMIGQKGVDYFRSVLKGSQLYTFLISLDSGVPQIARQVEYVALLNEVHRANQTLTQLLVEVQKNNHLLSQNKFNKGGVMDG
jgi:hypothetical protein